MYVLLPLLCFTRWF